MTDVVEINTLRDLKKWLQEFGSQTDVFRSDAWIVNSWTKCRKPNDKMLCLAYKDSQRGQVLFPTKITKQGLEWIASPIFTDYCEPLVECNSDDDYQYLLTHVFEHIRMCKLVVRLVNIPQDSKFANYCRDFLVGHGYVLNPSLAVPRMISTQYDLAKISSRTRRYIESAQRKIPNLTFTTTIQSPHYQMFTKLLTFNRKWWMARGYYGLIQTQKEKAFFNAVKEKFNMFVLASNGKPISIGLGFAMSKRLCMYVFGHDLKYEQLKIGLLHWHYVIEEAKKSKQEIDFMRGGYDFKYRFGARDYWICSLKST